MPGPRQLHLVVGRPVLLQHDQLLICLRGIGRRPMAAGKPVPLILEIRGRCSSRCDAYPHEARRPRSVPDCGGGCMPRVLRRVIWDSPAGKGENMIADARERPRERLYRRWPPTSPRRNLAAGCEPAPRVDSRVLASHSTLRSAVLTPSLALRPYRTRERCRAQIRIQRRSIPSSVGSA